MLARRQDALLEERKVVFSDFRIEGEGAARRKEYLKKQKQFEADDAAYRARQSRYLQLQRAVLGLKGVRVVNFAGTPITDRGLESLQQLVELYNLDLSSTSISDAGLESLAKLSKLQQLNLSSTPISDAVGSGIVSTRGITFLGGSCQYV